MPKHNVKITLQQILDSAREAYGIIKGQERVVLDANRILALALVRLLEIIGEAASRVPNEERTNYSSIPWTELIALRNRLIHAYDRIDLDIVWQIATQDLPELIRSLEQLPELS